MPNQYVDNFLMDELLNYSCFNNIVIGKRGEQLESCASLGRRKVESLLNRLDCKLLRGLGDSGPNRPDALYLDIWKIRG